MKRETFVDFILLIAGIVLTVILMGIILYFS